MIDLEQAERALKYLADTDEEVAARKARMTAVKERMKTTKAAEYLTAQGSSVKDREAVAETSTAYKAAIDELEEATLEFEIIKNKRLRAELTIEMWRSINSARNKGQIV
jgi:roadblock/LC7 domain-containing protein